ncbi:MAG: hypothetical protein JJV94_00985 [Sulfurospirillum sp.]|nr:hypothetical protein [Sulfurospirillum sp.]
MFFIVVFFTACYVEESSDLNTWNKEVPPKEVSASYDITTKKININWNYTIGATEYNVYRADEINVIYGFIGKASSTSYLDDNFEVEKIYHYKIEATNGEFKSPLSDKATVTYPKLEAPTGVLALYDDNKKAIDINWSSVDLADEYSVYRAYESDGSYSAIEKVSSASFSDNNIILGKTYYYKIEAINGELKSPLSTSTSVTYKELKAPTGVSASYNATTKQIDISWDPTNGATGYNAYRAHKLDGNYSSTWKVPSTSFSDSNITLGKIYHYKIEATRGDLESPLSTSTSAAYSFTNPGIYLSIIAFSENLTEKKFTRLYDESNDSFNSFIDERETEAGSSLYWAVDNAIMSIKNTAFPDYIDNISIVTFTDGLDISSLDASGYKHESNSDYLGALKIDINEIKVKDIPLSAYAIGLNGKDGADEEEFKKNLEVLSSGENNYTVEDVNDIEVIFKEIAKSLTKTSSSQSLALSVSLSSSGTKIRFTFDDANASESGQYIEATYERVGSGENMTHTLENITYNGLDCTSTSITGEGTGASKKYTFEDIKMEDGSDIDIDSIKLWSRSDSSSPWYKNDGFVPSRDSHVDVEKSSAAIVLVLDTGNFSANDFKIVQSSAKSFVETLLDGYNKSFPWYGKNVIELSSDSGDLKSGSIKAGETTWYKANISSNEDYNIGWRDSKDYYDLTAEIKVSAYKSSAEVLFEDKSSDSSIPAINLTEDDTIYIEVSENINNGNGTYIIGFK